MSASKELVAKIERIEVATIEPGDIVILHFPDGEIIDDVADVVDVWKRATGLDNPVVAFIGDVQVEIKRPESE